MLSLQIRWNLEINGIFVIKWRHYGMKEDTLEYWVILIFWFLIPLYPIEG